MLKLGIIREGKNPPDKRVPLTPNQCRFILNNFDNVDICVQKSPIRAFEDALYAKENIPLADDLADRDVIVGVKEVPLEMLHPNKTYFFFSHTIKEQPYNRKLLQTVLDKNIRLIDWECLRNEKGDRVIGFGRYAGIVGAYNGFRAFGLRSGRFDLKPAHQCKDREEMEGQLEKLDLPPIKILLTGRGRVANGAIETLQKANMRQVEIDDYLNREFDEPVFCRIGVEHYNKRIDGQPADRYGFYKNHEGYESNFFRFAKVTDLLITGHFYAEGAPFLITREQARHPEFRIRTIADISCDIDGPVAPTIRPSTIDEPIYGYNPQTESEDDFKKENVITVMAVDNLPCELPRDASRDFGEEIINQVLPQLLNSDPYNILKNATITQEGKLTQPYVYLQDYVDGK